MMTSYLTPYMNLFILADRFVSTVLVFRVRRMNHMEALSVIIFGIGTVICMSVLFLPSFPLSSMQKGIDSDLCFFSGVLTAGYIWRFNQLLFLFFNCIHILVMVMGYSAILMTLKKSAQHSGRTRKSYLPHWVLLLILTNIFCILPSMFIMIILKTKSPVSYTALKWVVTIFIPLNAMANPFLHTFWTLGYFSKLKSWGKHIERAV